jgi:hypothetical protein
MIPTMMPPSNHAFAEVIAKLERGEALLPHSERHVTEVVGVLKSYGRDRCLFGQFNPYC